MAPSLHTSGGPDRPSGPASSQASEAANFDAQHVQVAGEIIEPSEGEVLEREDAGERTRLLENSLHSRVYKLRGSKHGTFTQDDLSIVGRDSDSFFSEGAAPENGAGDSAGSKAFASNSQLAQKHGIRSRRWLYYSYYLPAIRWIRQYQWAWFRGDLVAAITMASFYIPMALSYASNLAHVPPINGLYSFVFNPVIYALLGSCPQMVVGPEAAGSLLVGQVVKTCIQRGNSGNEDDTLNAQIAGVVTVMAGSIIFAAGIARLGFLDGVLSRPFLRGFISAIGFVILVDQAVPELGLTELSKEAGVSHGSSVDKLIFLVRNVKHAHALTTAVSLGSFAIIMVFRTLKTYLQPRYPSVAYFPDRFLVVVLSALFTWLFAWDKKGLEVLGEVKSSGSTAIPFHWPFQFKHMRHIDTALSTSFIIALLGFFESSVAAKSLGEGTSGLRGMHLSANRELVALGAANLVGGMFQSLPAFGGYGRSKVNASTGGTTPMSSVLLSLITLICVLFLLPYFYFLPKGVLSAMVSVVAYSLVEECPHDIKFFIRIRGWTELLLMAVIFLSTIFYSLTLGIALGIGLSLLALIRHATKPRIQILGKVPGTAGQFENAEYFPENVEYVEGSLIVKIPEPLTFANTGALKTRLSRLEAYGSNKTHPSLPHVRSEEHNQNVIFDVHGVTSIDGSGTQVLSEIVQAYVQKGRRVIFCRLPRRRNQVYDSFRRSGIVDMCGGPSHFVDSVDQALKLSESENLEEYFDERGGDWREDRGLHRQSLVPAPFWSITLLDSTSGILSLGTTISVEVEKAKLQAEAELQNINQAHATSEWIQSQIEPRVQMMRKGPWQDHFKWTDLQGARGWWTTLMSGVWVNGAKVLKNQPVLFDIQCPFILAPPMAVARVYHSIGGAFRLPSPHDQYFTYPCLNEVALAFEIAGWNFPVIRVTDQSMGGQFSMGLLAEPELVLSGENDLPDENSTRGTGYCVGVLVESRMGMKKEWQNAGMQGVWVLGEPFFRGLGLVFDQENGRIGLRTY
ncbi:hypothetical protein DV735_g2674, partial [Chaetothyriales sp. CBS 134920]